MRVGRTRLREVSGSARTCDAGSGRRIRESLPSVEDVEKQSIAAKNVRVKHGRKGISSGQYRSVILEMSADNVGVI